MLHTLSLKNFRKHHNLQLQFTPGLNVIYGPNWSGKTTILSAISYALFGAKATPGAAGGLVTVGENAMEVQLGLSLNGQRYTVSRGPGKAQLLQDGRDAPIAAGQNPVTAEMESLAKISCADFLDFFITRQEEVFSLLTLSSSKLGQYVARVTGVDVIDRLLEEAKKQGYLAEGALSQTALTEEELKGMEELLAGEKALHDRITADIGLLRKQNEFETEVYREQEQEVAGLRQKLEEAASSVRNRAVAKGVLADRQKTLSSLESDVPEDKRKELRTKQQQLSDLRGKIAERTHWEERSTHLTAELARAKESLNLVKAKLQELPDSRRDEVNKEWSAKLNQLHTLEGELHLAEKAVEDSECPYCKRPFEGVDQENLKDRFSRINSAYGKLEEEVLQLQEELGIQQALSKRREELQRSKQQWSDYAKPLREEQRNLVEPKIVDVTLLPALEDLVKKMKKEVEEFTRHQTLLKAAKKEAASAQATLDAIEEIQGPTAGEVQKAEEDLKVLKETLMTSAMRMNRLGEQSRQLKASIHGKQGDIEEYQVRLAGQQAMQERSNHLKELTKFIRDNRYNFTVSFWSSLLGHASGFVREATSGDIQELRRNGQGRFSYLENGTEMPVEGSASGMQKAIFSTAVKASLSQALGGKLDVLFFDEVTAAASDETSLLFTSILGRLGKQTFLVSHRQADAAAAENLIAL